MCGLNQQASWGVEFTGWAVIGGGVRMGGEPWWEERHLHERKVGERPRLRVRA